MKRLLLGIAVLLVSATALIGFAHTQAGRPLLAFMPWASKAKGMCPLGYDAPLTAAARAAAQQRFAHLHKGAGFASVRPALGFALDRTTRTEIMQWASQHKIACQRPRTGHDLECVNISPSDLENDPQSLAIRDLWLDFDSNDRLVSVIALRRETMVDPIVQAFHNFTTNVSQTGADAVAMQDASAQRLQAGLLHQASAEYRFTNYYALARATHMPDGYLLSEEYHSLN